MDTGSIRPVPSVAEATAARPVDHTAGVATDLPAVKAVAESRDTASSNGDDRRSSFEDRAEVTTSPAVRKALAFDDSTKLAVVRKIRDPGGLVIDQLPSEAYLRMKQALTETMDAAEARSHQHIEREA